MATDRGTGMDAAVQAVLMDDPDSPRDLVARVTSHGVLIVSGVRDDGKRSILAAEGADTKSAATYQAVFRTLKTRGLTGVQLVTSDDHAGLRAAIDRYFQGAGRIRRSRAPSKKRAKPVSPGVLWAASLSP